MQKTNHSTTKIIICHEIHKVNLYPKQRHAQEWLPKQRRTHEWLPKQRRTHGWLPKQRRTQEWIPKKGVYRSDYPTKAFTAGVKGLVDFSHSLGALPKMRVPWLTWFWILPIIQMEKKEPRLLEILCKPLFAKTGNHAFSIDLLRRRIPKQDFRANRHASSF